MRHMRIGSLATAIVLVMGASTPALANDTGATAQCRALLTDKKHAEAEAVCARAADESREGKLYHGDYLSHTGDKNGAEKRYSEVLQGFDRKNPSELELAALRRRALVRFELGNRDYAGNDADMYLGLKPDDQDILQLGVLTTHWDDMRLRYLDKLVALKPEHADFHAMRAHALLQAGKPREALDAAEQALKVDPKSAAGFSMRGLAHTALGEHSKAERDHVKAAKLAPKDPRPHVFRGQALYAAQRFPEAMAAATDALAIQPDSLEALGFRFKVRMTLGDGEGALADIESMARLAPDLDVSEAKYEATSLMTAHQAMSAASITRMESDRELLLQFVRSHLQSSCGYYRLPSYEDNENLNAYRRCIGNWYKDEDNMSRANPSAAVMEAGDRFTEAADWVEKTDKLRCSNMPKKSRCIDDGLYARARAANEGMEDPKAIIGIAEFERLNGEVHRYNASVKRHNALAKTANFLQALANELSKQ